MSVISMTRDEILEQFTADAARIRDLEARLVSGREAGWNAAIEKAAEVADAQVAEDEAHWRNAGRDEDARSHYLWAKQTGEQIAAAIRSLTRLSDLVAVPREPSNGLLVSMAMRIDHGFGLASKQHQEVMLADMRRVYEEVVGTGFYRGSNEEQYRAMLAAHKEG